MKILIGGSPCTHWSIAQTKNRETEASGIGWELFLNYRIARDKYQPDFFLYENNKSMSPAIRAQITAELGVEPVRIGTIENDAKNQTFDSQQYRVYSPDAKSVTLCGNGGGLGAKTGLYAVPVAGRVVGRRINEQGHRDDYNEEIERIQRFEVNEDPNKTNCLSTVEKDNMIAVPVRVGAMPNKDGELGTSQSRRIYSTDGKSVSLQARPNGGGADGAATGLYAVPVIPDGKGQFVIKAAGGKEIPVYEVRGGRITIKGKTYPIKLADGFYIIRKLTVTECKRLQTVPDTYAFPVSDTQAYKMLGNGWTVDVIAHIMSHFTGLTEEAVEVLSMYDGMSCGHIALDKLGAEITTYYATEIDKYAVQTTQHNYPDTMQLGDAFQVRAEDWHLPEPVGMEAAANG